MTWKIKMWSNQLSQKWGSLIKEKMKVNPTKITTSKEETSSILEIGQKSTFSLNSSNILKSLKEKKKETSNYLPASSSKGMVMEKKEKKKQIEKKGKDKSAINFKQSEKINKSSKVAENTIKLEKEPAKGYSIKPKDKGKSPQLLFIK